jgi:hypothetical protein
MGFAITNLIYTLGLLVGMLFLLEVGRRIGLWRMAVDTEGARAGIGTVEGALLALLGLLIAFSFSGAAARFDARRQQIIDEANDIGSAYMLVDLLPSEAQPPLRDKFRLYVDSRLEAYRKMPDLVAARAEFERSKILQNEIWTQAIAATRDSGLSAGRDADSSRNQQNDQHFDRANHGVTAASADDYFRHARRTDVGRFFTGRLWDGKSKVAQLDAYDCLCRHPGINRVRHSRS